MILNILKKVYTNLFYSGKNKSVKNIQETMKYLTRTGKKKGFQKNTSDSKETGKEMRGNSMIMVNWLAADNPNVIKAS